MKVGLHIEELDSILKEFIDGHLPVRAQLVRTAIATAIEKNNEKLLKDIQHLISK